MDLEAIDLNPSSGKSHVVGRGDDAKARALAVENGMKWKCSRVGAWVSLGDCMARYVQARDAQPSFHCVCLECASIDAHIRKHGITTPTQTAKQEPEAVATKPKAKPVEQEPSAESNPFAGWERFDPGARFQDGESFVTLTVGRVFSFSKNADSDLGLDKYNSVDVFARKDKLGLMFHADRSGALALTKHGANRTISSRGLCRAFALDYLIKKRLPVREVAPGCVEVDLSTEVEA